VALGRSVAAAAAGAQARASGQMLIVLAKPEVKTAGDLDGKTILVAGVTSVSGEQLRDSLAAAGVSGAQFKQGEKSDIDELRRGDVAAAVVAVATPGIPADIDEIPGFHLLYFEVSPRAKP
jgi:ABC-type nitrate/sulfonate/bicarbonate transport system substrate-binding protein